MINGPGIAIMFVVAVIVIAGMLSGGGPECPRGSVTASGNARCR